MTKAQNSTQVALEFSRNTQMSVAVMRDATRRLNLSRL